MSAHRLAADAAHEFGGIAIDRSKPLAFKLNGRRIEGFAGDTILSAILAAGIDTLGRFGELPIGLSDQLAPFAAAKGSDALPIDRLPAADGLDLATVGRRRPNFRTSPTLDHIIDGIPEAPWLRQKPDETLRTDVLVIGGGVAGLGAADAAAKAGHRAILAERRPWLGGDARYFGPVGDEPSPETTSRELIASIAASDKVTTLTNADVFALHGLTVRLHRIVDGRGTVTTITARRIVLATGSLQRLPIFAGNRLPGVISAISAYHLAKRYGVAQGRTATVTTQSNYGYRLALRLHDAGVEVQRIVDPRVNPQSRFVDFAKASGLKLNGGQIPVAASVARRQHLRASFANIGTAAAALELDTDALIVGGPFQPDLNLWMLAGGSTHWSEGKLIARGQVEHTALAGSVAGHRTMVACIASGANAIADLFGQDRSPVEDIEIDALYETPETPTTIALPVTGAPAFLDAGVSLIVRPDPTTKPVLTRHAQAPSLGDVAASVELGQTLPADAGAVAEERGAPGGDLAAAAWTPTADAADGPSPWLAGRFGAQTQTIHLIVDGKRRFERGALVYANTTRPDPLLAMGVIETDAPVGEAGGFALISSAALAITDRFIVETMDGASPARIRKA